MRNSTSAKRMWTALFLTALAGCQTVPTVSGPPQVARDRTGTIHAPAASSDLDASTWVPVACIVFARNEANTPIARQFKDHLRYACEAHGIPFIEDEGPVPALTTAFLEILGVQYLQASLGAGRESGTYAWYSCQVVCSDRRSGSDHRPGSVGDLVAVSRLLAFDSDTVGRHASGDNSALRTLANQVAAFAGDGTQVRQVLLDEIRHMDAPDLTRRSSELFTLRQYGQASLYLTEVCRRFPDYQPAFCYLGACQAALGLSEEARLTLSTAVRLAPDTQEAARAEQWLVELPQSP